MSEPEAGQNMEKRCPQCGAALPTGALEGLCPACLLKQGTAADTAAAPEGASFQPPSVEEIARLFPQLEILDFVGKGGMGAVYKARQPSLDRLVALKILPPQAAGGPGFAERFSREARALAKLSHPNIVAIYEFGQVNDLSYFIMEFVDGLNLRQLERAGKLSPREALQIVPQICEALQFAHDEGIVHRDIKPENILLDKRGRVKIADFGIAKILGREPDLALTQTQGVLGTPQYMAPEQVEKPQSVDHRADIFSLGVVFYEMLTGELPLGKFDPPSSRMGPVQVDVRLDDVVLRALEKEPERRYQHASQVKTAVETISSTAPPPPSPDAESFAQGISDYDLSIKSCVRRGWALVRANFWPLIGVNALILALMSFTGALGGVWLRIDPPQATSALALLLMGPLYGGLYYYFLKKMRGEVTTVETAFAGFGNRFLHLFLAGFVCHLLIWLGFICLVLPGIYLFVAWTFALPLVIDQRLDFWVAMEVTRKVLTRHWWKLLGLKIVIFLVSISGVLACGVGLLVTIPVGIAALMYAYEDIFSAARSAAPAAGPSGTVVMPMPGKPSSPFGRLSKPVIAGLAAAVVFVVIVAFLSFSHGPRQVLRRARPRPVAPPAAAMVAEPSSVGDEFQNLAFGPSIERVIEFNNSERRALILGSGNFVTLAPGTDFGPGPGGVEAARGAGADLYFPPQEADAAARLTALDWRLLHDLPSRPVQAEAAALESVTPEAVREQLEYWTRQRGEPDGAEAGLAELLARVPARKSQNHTEDFSDSNVKLFVTRDGTAGVLQIAGASEDPAGMKIRYKLIEAPRGLSRANLVKERKRARDDFTARLEAAMTIFGINEKDDALGQVARDAAKAGEPEIVRKAIGNMIGNNSRDATAHEAALLLAKAGQRKAAVEIAKSIFGNTTRDQTLSELAK